MADTRAAVMPEGGVLVWVVADATVDGSETGTSFRQALGLMDRGLKFHDTMIHARESFYTWENRYKSGFEYMFFFSQAASPAIANLIHDRGAPRSA